LLTVDTDPDAVELMLGDGLLRCPDCDGVLARWGFVPRRRVRDAAGVVTNPRLRRSICSSGGTGCGRTHVLLPAFLLGRRLDVVEVVWPVLRACADGMGWRRLAALAGRPASTVRGWVGRARKRAEAIRNRFAQLEHMLVAADGGDMARVAPAGSGLGDALAQIGVCLAALRRTRPSVLPAMSLAQVVTVLSGGWLLGTRVLRPLLPGFPNISRHL
jgi:hypothetical protein